MRTTMDVYCKNLKSIRKNKNVSQKQLGQLLDVSQQQIAQYELGQSNPNLERLIVIADYFEVSLDYLLGRTEKDSFKKHRNSIRRD